jgi:hypothetical protein
MDSATKIIVTKKGRVVVGGRDLHMRVFEIGTYL